jgi:hypothetical protein
MKMSATWDIAPCSLVEADRYFIGETSVYYFGPHNSIFQKPAIFILITVRT